MEIISIEKKTFEELVSRRGQFVKRMDSINRQRGGRRMSDWMDNQDVCQALKISPRTLQTLRDSGRLPHYGAAFLSSCVHVRASAGRSVAACPFLRIQPDAS